MFLPVLFEKQESCLWSHDFVAEDNASHGNRFRKNTVSYKKTPAPE